MFNDSLAGSQVKNWTFLCILDKLYTVLRTKKNKYQVWGEPYSSRCWMNQKIIQWNCKLATFQNCTVSFFSPDLPSQVWSVMWVGVVCRQGSTGWWLPIVRLYLEGDKKLPLIKKSFFNRDKAIIFKYWQGMKVTICLDV